MKNITTHITSAPKLNANRLPARKALKQKGFTLIELMISSTLATLMSLAVLSIYVNQSASISIEEQRSETEQEAHRAFDLISRLLRQAEEDSISITYSTGKSANENNEPEIAGDAITIDFTLPVNLDIWPNTHIDGAVDKPAVRLSWHNGTNNNPYKIQLANSTSIANLGFASLADIAGSDVGSLARVVNLDFWPLSGRIETQGAIETQSAIGMQGAITDTAINGYMLRVTTRSTQADITYDDGTSGLFKNYRTYSATGVVAPRN